MTTTFMRVAATAAVAASVTACGSQHTATTAPAAVSPTVGTTTSASPPAATSPPALSRHDAQVRFLAIVAPSHVTVCAWNALPVSAPLADFVAAANNAAATDRRESIALQAVVWPAELRQPVADMVSGLIGEFQGFRQLGAAKTMAEVNSLVGGDDLTAANDKATAASELIREKLGLPSAPAHC